MMNTNAYDEVNEQSLEDLVETGVVHPRDMLELLQADGYFEVMETYPSIRLDIQNYFS